MPTIQSAGREYRADIDGLRAIAIISVVAFHAVSRICPGGFTGVDIFFVISGYLIGGHIYSEALRNQFSWARFYQRRAKRILPALYGVLIAFAAISYLLLSPLEFVHFARSAFAATLSASNILFWKSSNYFAPNAHTRILLMTWSLGVEEQFYFVIPVVMVLLTRMRRQMVFPLILGAAILSLAVSSLTLHSYPIAAFYLLYSRAWELLAGVALAVYESHHSRKAPDEATGHATITGVIGLLLIAGSFVFLNPSMPFPGCAALPSVIGSVLLIGSRGGWVNRTILSLSPLVYVGRISYSWYLWHWPLLAMMTTLRGSELTPAWSIATVCVGFGCAVLSYYFVERPFRSSQTRPAPLLLRYALASLVLLACLGGIWKSAGIPSRVGAVAGLDQEFLRFGHPCLVGDGRSAPNESPSCVQPPQAGEGIAVWGDSHAAALAPAIRHLSSKYGFSTLEFAKEDCPPLLGVGRYYTSDPARARDCIAFNQHVFEALSENPTVKVVVLDAFWEAPFDPHSDDGKLLREGQDPTRRLTAAQSTSLFTDAVRNTVEQLQARQKRVILVGDTPVFDTDPAWRIRTSGIPLRNKVVNVLFPSQNPDPGFDTPSDENLAQESSRQILKKTAGSIPGTTFWDMRTALCPTGTTCLYRSGRSVYFLDTNHLSLAGALRGLRGFSLQPSERVEAAMLSQTR